MSLRIGGLASGMDIDGLVEKLVSARRMSTNKLFQQKTTIQWQRESYREMNTKLYDFRNNKISNYRLEGTWLSKKVELSGNTNALTATASGSALPGTITIQVGPNLASVATNHSSGDIRMPDVIFDPNKPMSGQVHDFHTGTFTINDKTLMVDADDSLNDVIMRINKETDVSAYYDASSGKVAFTAKETGTVNKGGSSGEYIAFSGDFLTNTLKVTTTSSEAVAAQDAKVTVNGLETTQKGNTFIVNDVTITLKEAGGATTTLKVSNDTDKVVDMVKSFVSDYNEFVKVINDRLDETRYRNFQPLTDEQKKEMKERELELWEDKAKSGMLRNDPILSKLVNDLRMTIYGQAETGSDKYRTLFDIGITTGEYSEKGKLYIDENKLRKAIEEDPEAIMKLFAGSGTDVENQSGIGAAKRMYDDLQLAMNRITEKAGHPSYTDSQYRDESVIGKQLYNLNKRLDQENVRLQKLEEMYYRQFTAMESAINRYNAQSMYLMNAFGGNP